MKAAITFKNLCMFGALKFLLVSVFLPGCQESLQAQTAPSDIVFIYDNSGSMWTHSASIDSADQDTLFWSSSYACANTASDFISYAVQDTAYNYTAPQTLARTILLLPGNQVCREYAGDPYNSRGVVIRNAIRYLAQIAPASTVGSVGFAGVIEFPQPPLPLNSSANVTQLLNMIRLDSLPSTSYGPPLTLAKSWLNDTSLAKNPKHAIVFISDGIAADGNAGLNAADPAIPIYSIFLGKKPTPDTVSLKQLSNMTGGLFFRVDASKPAAIQVMLDSIIKAITESPLPINAHPGPASGTCGGKRECGQTEWGSRFPAYRNLLGRSIRGKSRNTKVSVFHH
ncbi:MAG: hypothetical protein JF616_20295 [Fibrobacteres bacterium]|nr:hypothetical protein [Fibrobacterota bacterium]